MQEVIEVMTQYGLAREDIDTVVELTSWGGNGAADPMSLIAGPVKAALTRAYDFFHLFNSIHVYIHEQAAFAPMHAHILLVSLIAGPVKAALTRAYDFFLVL